MKNIKLLIVLKAVALCFVFWLCLITFSLSATLKESLRLGILTPWLQNTYRNLLDETGLKKRKTQKQSLAPTMVTFSKFPCYFIACVTDQIWSCDNE